MYARQQEALGMCCTFATLFAPLVYRIWYLYTGYYVWLVPAIGINMDEDRAQKLYILKGNGVISVFGYLPFLYT